MNLELFAYMVRDGITVCPKGGRIPDSARRIFIATDDGPLQESLRSLGPLQLDSVVELAFRDVGVRQVKLGHSGYSGAIFYDGDIWAKTGDYVEIFKHTW